MNINLKDFVNYLSSADLNGLDAVKDLNKVVAFINLTTQDIHQRMVVNQAKVSIPLDKDENFYCIDDYMKEPEEVLDDSSAS